MTVFHILFYLIAALIVVSTGIAVTRRNLVHAVIYLILSFFGSALLFYLLGAPFLAALMVIVYAGAIMVLFLFVIMLLGAEQTGRTPAAWWMQPLALGLGGLLFIEALYIIVTQSANMPVAGEAPPNFGAPDMVGETLFRQYLLPFEVTSVLLLVAMIGAIVLTVRRKNM